MVDKRNIVNLSVKFDTVMRGVEIAHRAELPDGEIQGILITVSACSGEKAEIQIEKVMINQEKEGKTLAKEEDERLKDYYGTILEIPPEQIEICLK